MKKVAVIGYGGQGAWHCTQIEKSDVAELAVTYDIKENRREAAKANGIYVYESNEAIFADKSVDIIVVATPNDVHEDLVKNALLSGHNVICEKPVALSAQEFDRMLEAEKKSGKRLAVHQNRRWDVDFLGVKSVIDSGEIGEVIRVESRIHGSRGIPSDWRCIKKYGDYIARLSYSKVEQNDEGSLIIGDKGTLKIKMISQYTGVTLIRDGKEIPITLSLSKPEQMSGEAQRFADYILRFDEHVEDYEAASELCLNVHKCMDQIKIKAGLVYPETKV